MEENKLDVAHGEPWPANVLSNMWPHKFTFEGIDYSSMEAFLQSLKFKDQKDANRIAQLPNFEARKEGQKGNGWKKDQKLYWQGVEFDRQSDAFYGIVSSAYDHLYDQNQLFRLGLHLTKGMVLDHTMGTLEPHNTVLSRYEFINFLHDVRERYVMSYDWKTEFNKLAATCVVLDTETTNIDVNEAEIVEIAHTTSFNTDACNVVVERFRPIRPIPPEASAVHHITMRMLKGKPTFSQSIDTIERLFANQPAYFIAHNSDYDRKVLVESCKRDNADSLAADFSNTKWICTWRLAKAVLGVDYSKFQYNLSYLRYALNLDVSDELGAHDGFADVTVCAKLFETLVEMAYMEKKIYPDQDLGEQLYNLCWAPKKVETWPFGKYKGQSLNAIPTDFYIWAIENIDLLKEDHEKYDIDLATSVGNILEARM